MSSVPFVIAVHGGAGTISPQQADEQPYHEGLRAALRAGAAVLEAGGSALDAVQAAVQSLEDCPLFKAGRGAVYTADQTHEMDASVMEGSTLKAGAVAGINGIRNPVVLARAVMQHTDHVLLAGEGALSLARELGVTQEEPAYFESAERLAQLRRVRACVAHDVHARMAYRGETLAQAGDAVVHESLLKIGGAGGLVSVDSRGHVHMPFNTTGMYRGVMWEGEGPQSYIFRDK